MNKQLKKGFSSGGILERTLSNSVAIESLIPDSVQSQDERWMTLALLEAMNGVGWASPNPAVGCVLVKDGAIVARGFTQNYGGKHAERMAFESLQKDCSLQDLKGLSAYVTLEPCTHFGKQPPCVDLLFHPCVDEVIIACFDPDHRVSGRGIEQLKQSGKKVRVGVLEAEARAWHLPFLNSRELKKPLWVAKWAENQEGLLADSSGNSKWITNQKSRAYTHWLRQKYDAILVGSGTWLVDQPKLTVRDCAKPHHRDPVILIHDPSDRIQIDSVPPSIRIYKQKSVKELVEAIESTDFGFELQSVFCEGGAKTLNELFRLEKIDIVHRFIGQKDFGALAKGSPHRIHAFDPSVGATWECTTLCDLDYDRLQEWAKCF